MSEKTFTRRARIVAWLAALLVVALAVISGSAQAAVLDPGPPSIESLSVSQLSSHRATLVAKIDPDQLETGFQLWIEYANCQNVPPGHGECESISVRKVGEGTIPAGAEGQYVSATATHLQGEYVYGYWVVASNSAGERKSAEESFKALPEPTVEAESVTGQVSRPVELQATIDPHGQAVYYQFELVADADEYATELGCPEFSFGPPMLPACTGEYSRGALPIGRLEASCSPRSVSLDLQEAGVQLKVGSTYHYRVLVAPAVQTEDTIQWEGPPTVGPDQSFTVGEDGVAPQSEPASSEPSDQGGGSTDGDGAKGSDAASPPVIVHPLNKFSRRHASHRRRKGRKHRRRDHDAKAGRRQRLRRRSVVVGLS